MKFAASLREAQLREIGGFMAVPLGVGGFASKKLLGAGLKHGPAGQVLSLFKKPKKKSFMGSTTLGKVNKFNSFSRDVAGL